MLEFAHKLLIKLLPGLRVSPEKVASKECGKQQDGNALRHKDFEPGPEREWAALCEPILELVMQALRGNEATVDKSFFAVIGVCRSWRTVGRAVLFSELWNRSPLICHPAQLFQLSPKPCEGGLLKCFLQREVLGHNVFGGTLHKFTLYLGADYQKDDKKFLLCAVQNSKQHYDVFIDLACAGAPVAQLVSNVLRTSYQLAPRPMPWFQDMLSDYPSCVEGDTLCKIRYQLRVHGMMLPRRMKVSLPLPNGAPATAPMLTSINSFPRDSQDDVPALERISSLASDEDEDDVVLDATLADDDDDAHAVRDQDLHRSLGHTDSSKSRTEGVASGCVELVNKPPHWNEGLRCWCLNFRGRVKLASVKNLQLMRAHDGGVGAGRLALQFGKVDAHAFILDFNPAVVNAVQALAVALTTFETKLLL